MPNYRLNVKDFIYPREVPVKIITLIAAVLILALVTFLNVFVGLFFIINIGLMFLFLYQQMMTKQGFSVKVGLTQFQRIYNLGQIAADRLDMNAPPIYIEQSPELNAFASGFWGNYFVTITSTMVDGYSDDELLIIIGHEFTHIKANHLIFINITRSSVGLMKLEAWLQVIIKYVFTYLSRCQEYTCDRGGLIACGNIQAFATAFTKLAVGTQLFNRINMMDFYNQIQELDKNKLSILGEIELSHPYTVNRIRQGIRFYRSEKYRNFAAMQGKMGTSTLQGSVATGDLMQKIVNKAQSQQRQNGANASQFGQNPQGGFNQAPQYQSSAYNMEQKPSALCKKCGSPLKDNARFCTVCGTPYEQTGTQTPPVAAQEDIIPVIGFEETAAAGIKVCPQCGQNAYKEAVFCTECGYKF